METTKCARKQETGDADRDLSEQIKSATEDIHTRAEKTPLMQSYLKGQITLPEYKVLLCSLYEIYKTLEEEMDRNSSHPAVAPIFFPQEIARLESLEADLEYFLGSDWKKRVVIPAATLRYVQRLQKIGKESPKLLVAHAYTRYLGDLSGGQVLKKITQKALRLSSDDGLSFFAFPGVSSPNLFKQLYRSRMNSIELTKEEKAAVLEETINAFDLNIQVFDEVLKMLNVPTETADQSEGKASMFPPSAIMQFAVGLCVTLTTIGMGIYTF